VITYLALAIFLAGALALGLVFLVASQVARGGPTPYPEVAGRAYRVRLVWFFVLGGLLVVAFLTALPYVPYAQYRLASGPAAMHVTVTGSQYSWAMDGVMSAGGKVEFAVTSGDVNHGFGLYDPSGHLIGQVQAMPGYVNHLVMQFSQPGDYTVRCLEYCGPGHSSMYMTVHVGPCQTSCCC
jgi:cytochrome c oxidase subunit II